MRHLYSLLLLVTLGEEKHRHIHMHPPTSPALTTTRKLWAPNQKNLISDFDLSFQKAAEVEKISYTGDLEVILT